MRAKNRPLHRGLSALRITHRVNARPKRWAISPTLSLALAMSACGGQTIKVPEAERGTARSAGAEADEAVASGTAEGRDRPEGAAEAGEGTSSQPVLGARQEVPGTGVALRPPTTATPMPFGVGFLDATHRIQLSVVVIKGPESVLENIRGGMGGAAPTPEAIAPVAVGDQRGRIGYDLVRTQNGEIERSFLLVHDGERALGVIAAYERARAEAYRETMEACLRSVEWDRTADIDAGVALGLAIGSVEGLARTRNSTSSLLLVPPEAELPPTPGTPVLTVARLPMRLPPDRVESACPQLVDRLVHVEADGIEHEGALSDTPLKGCERLAIVDAPGGTRLAAYAALVFKEGAPVLVTGSVDATALSTWRPRFFAASRSLRVAEARTTR